MFSMYFIHFLLVFFPTKPAQQYRSREYFEQAGIPQGPAEAEETDPFQATREAMKLGPSSRGQFWKWDFDGMWMDCSNGV